MLTSPAVIQTAARLGTTAAQAALQWLLDLGSGTPNVMVAAVVPAGWRGL